MSVGVTLAAPWTFGFARPKRDDALGLNLTMPRSGRVCMTTLLGFILHLERGPDLVSKAWNLGSHILA
jgi:hypothetical protein